jgi:hypothetical protein
MERLWQEVAGVWDGVELWFCDDDCEIETSLNRLDGIVDGPREDSSRR